MKSPEKGDVIHTWVLLIAILSVWAFIKWYFWSITNYGFWYYYTEPVFKGIGIIVLCTYTICAMIQTVKYFKARRGKTNEKAK